MNSVEQKISFRPVTKDDLQLIHKWLQTEHVKINYSKTELTFDELRDKYLPAIHGEIPTQRFIILIDNKPIGQIQMYKLNDHPEYQKMIQINESAAGIDIFIGDTDFLHKGLGSVVIKKFLTDYVFRKLEVESCVIGPNPKNIAAIKAYQKAGFTYLKTVFNSEDNEEEYLMRITKEATQKEELIN